MQGPVRQRLPVAFHNRKMRTKFEAIKDQTHASIQGISNVNTATHHSVSIHLRSRHRLAYNS